MRFVTNHELGHTLGLEPSPHTDDLMNCCSVTPTVFTLRQRTVIDLAYQRRPGNAFPDNDRASTAQARGRIRVIACGAR